MPEVIFTIGHSTHSIEKFLELLAAHDISAVGDVRSHPYSRFNPQFNREALQACLQQAGLAYVFLGAQLGARSEDPNCYAGGTIQFDRLAATPLFRHGLRRVLQGARRHRIALMCAEKDPLQCHRAILVCRHLAAEGAAVEHILDDGRLERHDTALLRLLGELGLPERDLFRTREELVADAYAMRARDIAYTEHPPAADET